LAVGDEAVDMTTQECRQGPCQAPVHRQTTSTYPKASTLKRPPSCSLRSARLDPACAPLQRAETAVGSLAMLTRPRPTTPVTLPDTTYSPLCNPSSLMSLHCAHFCFTSRRLRSGSNCLCTSDWAETSSHRSRLGPNLLSSPQLLSSHVRRQNNTLTPSNHCPSPVSHVSTSH
jgi:hypothetical protein